MERGWETLCQALERRERDHSAQGGLERAWQSVSQPLGPLEKTAKLQRTQPNQKKNSQG